MDEYDDEIPNFESGEWVTKEGDWINIDEKTGEGVWKGRVRPDRLKSDGKFIVGNNFEIDIVSMSFTVPEKIKGGPYKEQDVMMILDACKYYQKCPNCNKKIENGMILMLEQFHIYPALCCGNMIWIRNGGGMIWKNMV